MSSWLFFHQSCCFSSLEWYFSLALSVFWFLLLMAVDKLRIRLGSLWVDLPLALFQIIQLTIRPLAGGLDTVYCLCSVVQLYHVLKDTEAGCEAAWIYSSNPLWVLWSLTLLLSLAMDTSASIFLISVVSQSWEHLSLTRNGGWKTVAQVILFAV